MMFFDHNAANLLEKFGLALTWKFLYLGYKGIGYTQYLSKQAIEEYGTFLLETGSYSSNEEMYLIVQLASARIESLECCSTLEQLIKYDRFDDIYGEDKWYIVIMDQVVCHMSDDPTDALLSVSNEWARMGCPDTLAHLIQGIVDKKPAPLYYTADTLIDIKSKIRAWISEKRSLISDYERPRQQDT